MGILKYNLKEFVDNLHNALESNPDRIDDIVEGFRVFLSHNSTKLNRSVKSYTDECSLVITSPKLKSFIDVCYQERGI